MGTYGGRFRDWCAEHWPEQPLPWQGHTADRLLEHDADGRLVWRRAGISVPRQVGKSVLLRQLAAWRINSEDLFGEPQTVLHVAHALNTTEEVFWPAIETARLNGWVVREANGQMKIQVGSNRWVPRSTQTGYGFTLSMALVDEAWAVAPRRVESAYAPTLSARESGQVVMFSSANEEATPLFPRFRAQSRDGWLLLEWSAPEDADPYDRDVWQAATPVPLDATRAALMGDELASDPRTFAFERLNRWPAAAGLSWGQKLVAMLPEPADAPWSGPVVLALESDRSGGWGAAAADGQHVEVGQLETLDKALVWLLGRSSGAWCLLTHQAVASRIPADFPVRPTQVSTAEAQSATALLRDRIRAGQLTHHGALPAALAQAHTAGRGDHEYIAGRTAADHVAAAKAAAWAVWKASTSPVAAPQIK